jgi:predicted signal transduction protein with EAL and GGDEF domain
LQSVGCHYLQGYYYSKPVSAEAIEQMLEREREEAAQIPVLVREPHNDPVERAAAAPSAA